MSAGDPATVPTGGPDGSGIGPPQGSLYAQQAPGALRGRALRELWRHKLVLLAAGYLLFLAVGTMLAPLLTPHGPTTIDLVQRFQPPGFAADGSWTHPLGTDGLGRDVLSRLLYGARSSLVVGLGVVAVAGTVGTLLGIVAGYLGGRAESIIMRLADAQLAFPGLLLILMVLAFVGQGLLVMIALLSLYGWMIFARLARGMTLQLRQTPAIHSAELLGCSTSRIVVRHVLPVLSSALLTQSMVEFARMMLAEASLSYLGLGVQPPGASLGLMVAENQGIISQAWWTVVFPGATLALAVLSANIVANWLRVQTDPQQRARQFAPRTASRGREAVAGAVPEHRASAALLEVEGLCVSFHTPDGPVPAVQDVRFSIAPGETLGIVGESGSGKSTAAAAILDLVPPPGQLLGGEIRWEGKVLPPAGRRRLRGSEVTMIFQDPMTSLNPLVTVGRQLSEVLVKHKGMRRRAAMARAEELLSLVGIPSPHERLAQRPHELSGGMRQRVMIAMALAPEPKLLVADEPTTALDATIQAQILDLIVDLQQRFGIAMILITHDLGVVARACDQVVVMYGGRVAERGPVEEIFLHPRHRYTTALMATAPSLHEAADRLPSIPGSGPRGALTTGCPFEPRCAHSLDECSTMPALEDAGTGHVYACWNPAEGRQSSEAGSARA